MDIIQVVVIGIVGTILTITVKQYKPELAALLALATGILILFFGFSALQSALDRVFAIANAYNINTAYIGTVVRIIAIAYICQFASEMCRDSGQGAIASKIEFCAKILILLYSLPVVDALLTMIVSILP
jgi:stage III sporulation protein AD